MCPMHPIPSLDSPLVSVNWLADNLEHDKLVVLDASVPPVVPGYISINRNSKVGRDGEGDKFSVVPGARRFDYDKKVCKPHSALPHTMPGAELFEGEARKLGIDSDSVIVVYDDVGLYAAPRAWWMFKAMGHKRVAVLEGGLPAWIEAGLDIADDYDDSCGPGNFEANEDPDLFCDFMVVLSALDDVSCSVLDARSAGRFAGTEAEPRPLVRKGHMPNAKNLPFPQVLDGGRLKPVAELQQIFSAVTSTDKKLITSCGSGITACILTLAAEVAGYDKLAVYDGSWAEWGLPGKLPVVTD